MLCLSGEVLQIKPSGYPESLDYNSVLPHSPSVLTGSEETETGDTWLSDPTKNTTVTGASGEIWPVNSNQEHYQQKIETYIFGLIQRRALPMRPSKPRTSLVHDVQPVGMVRHGNLCHKEEQHSPKQESVPVIATPSQCSEGIASLTYHNLVQNNYLDIEFTEEAPPLYRHLQQSVQDQAGFYLKSRQVHMSRSTLLDYPSCRMLQTHPDSSNSEPDLLQHFHSYPPITALSNPPQPPCPAEQLVNAEYIPAQPCLASTRAYAHHHSNGSGVPKAYQITFSLERGHHHQDLQPTAPQIHSSKYRGGPKKFRSNEDKSGGNRKLGKKTCRSQSENSLPRVPERKYNTVERDGGGSGRGNRNSQSKGKKQLQGSGNYRRWQSTLELSQDEADQPSMQTPMQGSSALNQKDHCLRRTRKSRSTHTSYACSHRIYHQHIEYQLEKDQIPMCQPCDDYSHPHQGESSMSEADSPDSSSLSSDSEESSGLVWPQQLPPQLSLPSPPMSPGAPLQPKAFVKIKASHALKKKILRFRTGSLKVMTTV